jgi:hypothetical protein
MALGKADYAHPAYYSQAFFALSIGLERAAKLALSLNAAIETNGSFLSGQDLRVYGHDLDRLLQKVEAIAEDRRLKSAPRPATDIHSGIVTTLTAFAMNVTRYYNLEVLAVGHDRDRSEDPIAMWHRLVTRPVLADHYPDNTRRRDEARARFVGREADPHGVVRSLTENGQPIRSFEEAARQSAEASVARPWERMYVLQLCRFVGTVVEQLGAMAQAKRLPVPYLHEWFYIFRLSDRDFRTRKKWTLD